MEIAAPWSKLTDIFDAVREDNRRGAPRQGGHLPLCRTATPTARAWYFTFAATPPPDEIESTYIAMWDAGTRAVLASGGNLSHHHGVGLNRSRFMSEALGPAHGVLQRVKDALDPERRPQPRQARVRVALRRNSMAMTDHARADPTQDTLNASPTRDAGIGKRCALARRLRCSFAVPLTVIAAVVDSCERRAQCAVLLRGDVWVHSRRGVCCVGAAGRHTDEPWCRQRRRHLPGCADRLRGHSACRRGRRELVLRVSSRSASSAWPACSAGVLGNRLQRRGFVPSAARQQ